VKPKITIIPFEALSNTSTAMDNVKLIVCDTKRCVVNKDYYHGGIT
jgi:hypothetical protein